MNESICSSWLSVAKEWEDFYHHVCRGDAVDEPASGYFVGRRMAHPRLIFIYSPQGQKFSSVIHFINDLFGINAVT